MGLSFDIRIKYSNYGGADKSFDCSLCDKSTKFSVVILNLIYYFGMSTIKNS